MIKSIIALELKQAYSNSNIFRKISEPVIDFDEILLTEINDLKDTFENAPRCVGIAAPQIGLFKRIIIINELRSSEDKNHIIAINPEILEEKGEFEGYLEGFLSIPGFKGFVNRQLQVKIKYQDISGGSHFIETEGFLARIFLHEIDHLDDVLFIDRVDKDTELVPFVI
ncbi:peptide deformylase [Flavobacterium sp. UBA6031]|uniref:peptide deformylase n=1 Tax=Flavobacterium sp. UBA6031 TaxID=1946551 RepID=UPI0025C16DF6|nr:peptide deformylase [Flavobacterium sp. UBA6031]